MKRTIIFILVLAVGTALFAKNFSVVYLNRTEVNMEATKYIKKQIKKQKAPLKATFRMGFSKVENSTEPVAILNTGSDGGIDSKIESFLSGRSDKERFVLVNLYRMGNKTFYSTTAVTDSSVGVDEISASSYYDDGRNSQTDAMHEKWVTEMFTLVQERM